MTFQTDRNHFYELIALENAIEDFIFEYKNKCGKAYVECVREIKPMISNYYIHGIIVYKKEKGCSHFYKLLCANDKNDGWVAPCNGMEKDLTEFNPSYNFEREIFFLENLGKIMSLIYFNRIKQFMIRLYRKNLLLGNKSSNKIQDTIIKCYACNAHPESRIELTVR